MHPSSVTCLAFPTELAKSQSVSKLNLFRRKRAHRETHHTAQLLKTETRSSLDRRCNTAAQVQFKRRQGDSLQVNSKLSRIKPDQKKLPAEGKL